MGFGHRRERDDSVFGDEGGEVVPPAAVFHGGLVNDFPIAIHELHVAEFDDGFEVEIGFFQLVPELEVGGGELEGLHVVIADHLGSHHVEAGEDPAAAGAFLIEDAFGADAVAEV